MASSAAASTEAVKCVVVIGDSLPHDRRAQHHVGLPAADREIPPRPEHEVGAVRARFRGQGRLARALAGVRDGVLAGSVGLAGVVEAEPVARLFGYSMSQLAGVD